VLRYVISYPFRNIKLHLVGILFEGVIKFNRSLLIVIELEHDEIIYLEFLSMFIDYKKNIFINIKYFFYIFNDFHQFIYIL